MHVNLVVLTGRLVADPRLRRLPSGDPVVSFSVAVNRNSRKKSGEWEPVLEGFFDCEAFDDLALQISENFKKGAPVQLTGTLLQKTFQGNDGNEVRKVEIRTRSIGPVFMPRKAETAGNGSAAVESVSQPA